MKIIVTREDIGKGVAGNARRCPVASAAQRALNDPRVHVAPGKLFYYQDGIRHWLALPTLARDFMYCFDVGMIVFPFEFEVAI